MGLAASQGRILSLIGQSHNNNLRLMQLTMSKRTLANQMQGISREYQKALCSKKMQWTNNKGVTYSDISYSTLMRPNASNMQSPVSLSDYMGRIVVDANYKKYAEMISPNGVSGASWSGDTRSSILAELTGIPKEVIDNADSSAALRNSAENKYSSTENEYDKWLAAEFKSSGAGSKYVTIDEFAEKLGSSNGSNLAKLYKQSTQGGKGDYSISSSGDLKSLINNIQNNMQRYFAEDELLGNDRTKFKEACNDVYKDYSSALSSSASDETRQACGITGSAGKYKVNIENLFKAIMQKYTGTTQSFDNVKLPLRDTSSSSWKNWRTELDNKYKALEDAESVYNTNVDEANMAMTADQESLIKYYDDLFRSIADNGWVYDAQINDNDYLNQMLQNNSYYLTTITRNECYDDSLEEDGNNWDYEYNTTLASTFSNIITINDSEAASKALAKYEDDRRQVDDKEARIDEEIKNIETQQAAIKEMIESIKKIKDDNIDRTFKLWS